MNHDHVNVLTHRSLSLGGASLIGTGATCRVYLLPDDNVVKVLFTTDFAEAEREIRLAKWAFLKGLPTAISYDVADVDGHPGLLYESLGRDNLRNHLRGSAENRPELLRQYLALLKSIDAISVESGQLPSAKQKALSELRDIRARFSEPEYEAVQALINTIPEVGRMVHGDCHIKNIKMVGQELFLIDLDTLSSGDPIFELSALCCAYEAYSALNLDENGRNSFFEMDHRIIQETFSFIMNHYYEEISEAEKADNLAKTRFLTCVHMMHELNPADPGETDLFSDMYGKVREQLPSLKDLVLKR